ncbi:MAG TPA: hypothetical protein PL045_12585 [Chitinophagaceae bacterium]|nr:hypothetical protein [Chitinophagaceae bacterium]
MRKILKYLLIAIVVFLLIWCWWKFYFTYSEGNRSGLLQKVSYKGNVFKTYEGELVMSNIINMGNSQLGTEKFYFSITNETLGQKMQQYEGSKVMLHYQQKNGTLPWRGDSPYIVDSVVIIEK